jgi:hypothetical protein
MGGFKTPLNFNIKNQQKKHHFLKYLLPVTIVDELIAIKIIEKNPI